MCDKIWVAKIHQGTRLCKSCHLFHTRSNATLRYTLAQLIPAWLITIAIIMHNTGQDKVGGKQEVPLTIKLSLEMCRPTLLE